MSENGVVKEYPVQQNIRLYLPDKLHTYIPTPLIKLSLLNNVLEFLESRVLDLGNPLGGAGLLNSPLNSDPKHIV